MDTINFGETRSVGPKIVREVIRALVTGNTVYDDNAGVYYEPFILDGRVGYRVASNRPGIGTEKYLYFNPTDESDDGVPNVFVYQGDANDPAEDASESVHFVIEDVGYQRGEVPVEGAEAEHAAWVASSPFAVLTSSEACCFEFCTNPATHKVGGEIYFPMCDHHYADRGMQA